MSCEESFGDSTTYFRTPVGAPEGHPLTPPTKMSSEGTHDDHLPDCPIEGWHSPTSA